MSLARCALVELVSQRLKLTPTSLQLEMGRVRPDPFGAAERSQELQRLVLHYGAGVGREPQRGAVATRECGTNIASAAARHRPSVNSAAH